jgi:hypothetical protein
VVAAFDAPVVLEELADGALVAGWRDEAIHDVLDLRLACKGCAADCPTGVDMATYKAEVLHQSYRRRLRPPAHDALGWLPRWARLVALAPGLVNGALRGCCCGRHVHRALLARGGARRAACSTPPVGHHRWRPRPGHPRRRLRCDPRIAGRRGRLDRRRRRRPRRVGPHRRGRSRPRRPGRARPAGGPLGRPPPGPCRRRRDRPRPWPAASAGPGRQRNTVAGSLLLTDGLETRADAAAGRQRAAHERDRRRRGPAR